MELEIGYIIYIVQLLHRPHHQTDDLDKKLLEKMGIFVDGRNCNLWNDFNNCIDWKTRQPPAVSMPLFKFVDENLLIQWIREPIKDENTLSLVLTSDNDFVEDLCVNQALGNSN